MKVSFKSDPEILGGDVCFEGTRIPVSTVVGYLQRGHSNEEILKDYPSLKEDDINMTSIVFFGVLNEFDDDEFFGDYEFDEDHGLEY